MKIVNFNREKLNTKSSNNNKTQTAWIKTIPYNSIFPIADIISSLTLGFIVLYGIKILNGDTFTTLEIYFRTPCSRNCSTLAPADKFNEMQLGMIATAF
jgi:hypothetical protein